MLSSCALAKLQWKRCFINKSASLSLSLFLLLHSYFFFYQLVVVWPHYTTHSVNEALFYWSLYFAFCSRSSCNPRISTVYLLQYTWRQLESCEPPKTSSAPFITHVRHIITSTTKAYTTRCFSSWRYIIVRHECYFEWWHISPYSTTLQDMLQYDRAIDQITMSMLGSTKLHPSSLSYRYAFIYCILQTLLFMSFLLQSQYAKHHTTTTTNKWPRIILENTLHHHYDYFDHWNVSMHWITTNTWIRIGWRSTRLYLASSCATPMLARKSLGHVLAIHEILSSCYQSLDSFNSSCYTYSW